MNEGGFQAIPKLQFPGGVITGCAAGLLNIAQLKGSHNAIESGIIAADTIHQALATAPSDQNCINYETNMAKSKAIQELRRVRNIRPGFYRGRIWGLGNALLETALHGYSPWTYSLVADHTKLQPKDLCTTITYPKPDGNYIFSKTDSVRLSATNHTEDQPCHLILKDPSKAYAINYKKFGGPSSTTAQQMYTNT